MKSLLICSNEQELIWLKQQCKDDYCIGTVDYDFFRRGKKNEENIFFLEAESLMPKEKVWEVTDIINNIIKKCNLEKEYLYLVSYHIEGGIPLQIAQMILNIDILVEMISQNNIQQICMVDNKKNWQLNEAAFLVANAFRMQCLIVDEDTGSEKLYLYTLRNSEYYARKEKNFEEWQMQYEMIKKFYKRPRKGKNNQKNRCDIGCLYPVVNNQKHLFWFMNEINEYRNCMGLNIIAFYDSDDIKKMRECGLNVDVLEDYLEIEVFLTEIREHLINITVIKEMMEKELRVNYRNVDLSIFLRRKLLNCFERDCIEHIYIDCCMQKYFKNNEYKYIKAWGNSNFWQTILSYQNTRNANTKLYLFDNDILFLEKMNEPNANIIYMRIFPNEKHKNTVLSENFKGDIYYCPNINYQKRFYCNLGKRKRIGKRISILFAPSCPFVGVRTYKNYCNICKTILSVLPSSECKLLFKNHPNIDKGAEEEIYRGFRNNNDIEIIDKSEGINSLWNDVDFVITDYSTVLADAVMAQRPVFCIAGCQDYQLAKKYSDGFYVFHSVEDMCLHIQQILARKEEIDGIIENILLRQNEFMRKIIGEYSVNVEKQIDKIFRKEGE